MRRKTVTGTASFSQNRETRNGRRNGFAVFTRKFLLDIHKTILSKYLFLPFAKRFHCFVLLLTFAGIAAKEPTSFRGVRGIALPG